MTMNTLPTDIIKLRLLLTCHTQFTFQSDQFFLTIVQQTAKRLSVLGIACFELQEISDDRSQRTLYLVTACSVL